MRDAGNAERPRGPTRLIRIRTDDWPARDRAAMFRDLYGEDRVRVEPTRGEPLRIDATIFRVPELALVWAHRSPLRSEFADGTDRLVINLGGPAIGVQRGREMSLERGDAIALGGSDRGSFTTTQAGRLITLQFPHGALGPLLKDPQHAGARLIARQSPALRLLRGYVHAAHATESMAAGGLPQLAIAHMYDLAAMALGAARDAAEIANGRGVRVARLRAIRADILARLDGELSVEALAARHGVSARYVRMLFESEGTSVTDFVREERLKRAHAMLLSPRFAALKIADVAFRVGFNDLSYFNRTFRRQFGRTPREVRAGS